VATFVLLHGGGDSGWHWHLVEPELRKRGHHVVAPDLPADDGRGRLEDFVDSVVTALEMSVGDVPGRPLVVVGHSFGGFTAPLVAARLRADVLAFVTGMIPVPGEAPDAWWANSRYGAAVAEQAAQDGGLTGHDDPLVSFYHDVPRPIADEALRRERHHPPRALSDPWPLPALPDVPTRFVLCTEDRFFPQAFMRRLVAERLPGVVPDEIAASHCVALSRPEELADLLEGYALTTA
jgi:pimeloyl-ACP methyl ester carboxylesterase